MTSFIRRLLPLAALTLTLAGCVAYPAGYYGNGSGFYGNGYAYGPGYAPSVAVAVPYGGGYGYHRW